MGRRSANHTKSGKFMNPADQERKTLRKKELKRNKKQRTQVRSAILKSKDPDEIIEELEKMDRSEFEGGPQSLKKTVMDEKRSKLKGTFYNVLTMYRNEKQDDKVKAMQIKMQQYEIARLQKEQNFEAVKFSVESDPTEIPLPDGFAASNAAMTPLMPSSIPAHLLLPEPRAGILKKATLPQPPIAPFRAPPPPPASIVPSRSQQPPGPPCGIPPPLSDSEDDEREEEPSDRYGRSAGRHRDSMSDRKKVRFGEADIAEPDEDDYGPVESKLPMFLTVIYSVPASIMAPQSAPLSLLMAGGGMRMGPPGGMPPMMPQLPRAGLRVPPPPPYGKPRPMTATAAGIPNPAAVISAEPIVNKRPDGNSDPASTDDVIISASPQLRDLRRETTRFVPTALRVNRAVPPPPAGVRRPPMPRPAGSSTRSLGNTKGPQMGAGGAKSTDEAYADFMKEMSNLM